ncbi:YdeI family protein [soil metagenome]
MKTTSAPHHKVDAYLEKATRWQDEMKALRALLLASGLTEELKWYQPVYTLEGRNVAIISSFKEHCIIGFFKGALLRDEQKVLSVPGENTQSSRFFKFTSMGEIKRQKYLIKAYIQEAIQVEKSGLKVEFKKISERTLPEELQKQFSAQPALQRAFESLTPGRQRAYLLHFSSPKQSATRVSRIEKCAERILNGLGLTD